MLFLYIIFLLQAQVEWVNPVVVTGNGIIDAQSVALDNCVIHIRLEGSESTKYLVCCATDFNNNLIWGQTPVILASEENRLESGTVVKTLKTNDNCLLIIYNFAGTLRSTKIDSQGNINWSHEYSFNINMSSFVVSNTNDGAFFLCTTYQSGTNRLLQYTKLTSNGLQAYPLKTKIYPGEQYYRFQVSIGFASQTKLLLDKFSNITNRSILYTIGSAGEIVDSLVKSCESATVSSDQKLICYSNQVVSFFSYEGLLLNSFQVTDIRDWPLIQIASNGDVMITSVTSGSSEIETYSNTWFCAYTVAGQCVIPQSMISSSGSGIWGENSNSNIGYLVNDQSDYLFFYTCYNSNGEEGYIHYAKIVKISPNGFVTNLLLPDSQIIGKRETIEQLILYNAKYQGFIDRIMFTSCSIESDPLQVSNITNLNFGSFESLYSLYAYLLNDNLYLFQNQDKVCMLASNGSISTVLTLPKRINRTFCENFARTHTGSLIYYYSNTSLHKVYCVKWDPTCAQVDTLIFDFQGSDCPTLNGPILCTQNSMFVLGLVSGSNHLYQINEQTDYSLSLVPDTILPTDINSIASEQNYFIFQIGSSLRFIKINDNGSVPDDIPGEGITITNNCVFYKAALTPHGLAVVWWDQDYYVRGQLVNPTNGDFILETEGDILFDQIPTILSLTLNFLNDRLVIGYINSSQYCYNVFTLANNNLVPIIANGGVLLMNVSTYPSPIIMNVAQNIVFIYVDSVTHDMLYKLDFTNWDSDTPHLITHGPVYQPKAFIINNSSAYISWSIGNGTNDHFQKMNIDHLTDEDYISPNFEVNVTNYPNPFHKETTISCKLTHYAHPSVSIYNIKGQLVKSIPKVTFAVGVNDMIWDGTDSDNNSVSSGIYFCKITIGGTSYIRRMILLK